MIGSLTDTSVDPAPTSFAVVNMGEARVSSVPYSKWAVVACAFGFTVPLRAAVCIVIAVAGAVDVVGGGGAVDPPPPPHE